MDNTSQHRSPMKNSFSVETIFLQNIIDLINWTLCTLNLSELPTRARHRHLREQTCFYTWRIQWRGDWSNFEFFFFSSPFPPPPPRQAIRHDQSRGRQPSQITKLSTSGHTLARRVWLVSFYWRLLVSPWTPILRIRDYAVVHHGCANCWTVDAFVSQNEPSRFNRNWARSIPLRFHGIMSIAPPSGIGILFVFKIYFENPEYIIRITPAFTFASSVRRWFSIRNSKKLWSIRI